MRLWLLSFTGNGTAVIIKAESLSHARLLAAARGYCRASLFDEGYAIDPDLATMIPTDLIGRMLSRDEVAKLLKTLIVGLFSDRRGAAHNFGLAELFAPLSQKTAAVAAMVAQEGE
jgi:hypothetical protein